MGDDVTVEADIASEVSDGNDTGEGAVVKMDTGDGWEEVYVGPGETAILDDEDGNPKVIIDLK